MLAEVVLDEQVEVGKKVFVARVFESGGNYFGRHHEPCSLVEAAAISELKAALVYVVEHIFPIFPLGLRVEVVVPKQAHGKRLLGLGERVVWGQQQGCGDAEGRQCFFHTKMVWLCNCVGLTLKTVNPIGGDLSFKTLQGLRNTKRLPVFKSANF